MPASSRLIRVLPLVLVAGISAFGCNHDPQTIKAKHLRAAEKHAAEGRMVEATLEYRNAIQADPRDGQLRLKLADAYYRTGDARNAIAEYLRAADLLPTRTGLQLKAGSLLLLAGRFDDAKVRAVKALATSPQNVDAQILLANALAGLKDFPGALKQIEEAIRLAPNKGMTYAVLGSIQNERGRLAEAEAAFRKATALDSRSVQAKLAFANFYSMQGRWPEAEHQLDQALALDPNNALAHRAMASMVVLQDRVEEAEPHLKKLAELTHSPEAAFALADYYASRGNESSARRILKLLADAASPGAIVRLAALDHAAGRHREAYARVEQALAKNGTDLDALVVKTGMLLADGRRDEAVRAAQVATRSHPDSAEAFFALGGAQAARNQTDAAIEAFNETLRLNPRAAAAQVALSGLHMTKGRSRQALALAQDAVQSDPRSAPARLALARGLIASGSLDQAQAELNRLSAEYPNNVAVLAQMGILLERKNDQAGARRVFARVLELEPNSIEALSGLVALDLAAKQPQAARERLADRVARRDAPARLLVLGARTYLAGGDAAGAEGLLRRALERDPNYLEAYAALGQLYVQQRQLDAALAEFDALAQRESRPATSLTVTGLILYAQGRMDEARGRFERALDADPYAPVPANNLAWMHAQSGRHLDQALQLAQTAKRGLPDASEVDDTLGFIYYRKQMFPEAVAALRAAAERDAGNATYQFHLGLALAGSGDKNGAADCLGRALAIRPDFEGAAEARAALQTLRSR